MNQYQVRMYVQALLIITKITCVKLAFSARQIRIWRVIKRSKTGFGYFRDGRVKSCAAVNPSCDGSRARSSSAVCRRKYEGIKQPHSKYTMKLKKKINWTEQID